ncbi:hypothetical protein ZWY2020_038765 [Hordeum vulgare]|nr:hypothetical protein ZWY2020_038765 [Hordeum vulgare]
MELACRVILLLLLPINLAVAQNTSREEAQELHVGVILDLGSIVGKMARTSVSLAMEDFCAVHPNYSTKLVLHVRDSMSDDVQAASQALIIYFYKKKHKSIKIVLDNENRPEESGMNEENSEAQEGNQGGD